MMGTILAVITDWDMANQVLTRTVQLGKTMNLQVRVYAPVSDQLEEMNRYIGFDNYRAVKDEIYAASEQRLSQLVADSGVDYDIDWQSKPYKGVAVQAEKQGAELIVMAMNHHTVVGDLMHKADDWHLLHEAPCPILFLSPGEHPFKSVIAAVDCLDESEANQALNARILDQAKVLSESMGLPFNVVSVVPDPSYVYTDMSASALMVDYLTQATDAAKQSQTVLLSRLGISCTEQKVVVGRVEIVLEEVAADAGLVVVGTIANKGWKGLFIGNTAERILSHLSADMLVVN